MRKIVLLGTHGQKNWGDELLLDVFMHQLQSSSNIFCVNTYAPDSTREQLKKFDVRVFHTRRDMHKFIYHMATCDAVIFAGGSILKELYVSYGGNQYGTLRIIDSVVSLAKLLGKPIYLCNVGVGPLTFGKGTSIAEGILNKSTYLSLRDGSSMDYVQGMNIKTPYELSSDAAFSIDRLFLGLSKSGSLRSTKEFRIGVNLCRNIQNNDNWDYFLTNLADDMKSFHEYMPNTRFVGFAMQSEVKNNNDEKALQELKNILDRIAPKMRFDVMHTASIYDIATTIDSLDFVIAERLHALIMSVVIGKPIIALEYDIKVKSTMLQLGLEKYGVDINQTFSKGSILQIMQEITANYASATSEVNKSYTRAHKRASASFIKLRKELEL